MELGDTLRALVLVGKGDESLTREVAELLGVLPSSTPAARDSADGAEEDESRGTPGADGIDPSGTGTPLGEGDVLDGRFDRRDVARPTRAVGERAPWRWPPYLTWRWFVLVCLAVSSAVGSATCAAG